MVCKLLWVCVCGGKGDKPDMSVISIWLALSRSVIAALSKSSDIDVAAIAAAVELLDMNDVGRDGMPI